MRVTLRELCPEAGRGVCWVHVGVGSGKEWGREKGCRDVGSPESTFYDRALVKGGGIVSVSPRGVDVM